MSEMTIEKARQIVEAWAAVRAASTKVELAENAVIAARQAEESAGETTRAAATAARQAEEQACAAADAAERPALELLKEVGEPTGGRNWDGQLYEARRIVAAADDRILLRQSVGLSDTDEPEATENQRIM